jgi:hypothetical protein
MEPHSVEERLRRAYRSDERVEGLTHSLYRYPARFSPLFAAAAVEAFSDRDDLVIDPFVGGGTTAVEALVRGRRFLGFDVNALSMVLTRAKTTPLTRSDHQQLLAWARGVPRLPEAYDQADRRLRNAPPALMSTLASLANAGRQLPLPRQRDAASAVLLGLGQWAMDGLAQPRSPEAVIEHLETHLERFILGISDYALAAQVHVQPSRLSGRRSLFEGEAHQVAVGRRTNRFVGRASLVLTSPPYPGVHVLYHRWQVGGRAETPLPYWLAGMEDGAGASYYTMGGRTGPGVENYFTSIASTWRALRRLLRPGALVVQMVAFPKPEEQISRYLEAMRDAGFVHRPALQPEGLRTVPNRRWYNRVDPERGQTTELVFVHELER